MIAYGFVARVLTGPKLSPLGQFATRVAAPRLGEPKYVAGPPKRFAQAMGVGFSLDRRRPLLRLRLDTAAWVLIGVLAVAAPRVGVRALPGLPGLRAC